MAGALDAADVVRHDPMSGDEREGVAVWRAARSSAGSRQARGLRLLACAGLVTTVVAVALAGTPAEAAQPGKNGMIAFWRGTLTAAAGAQIGIHVANPDGSGVRAVGSVAGRAVQPEWSPDGNEIVFTSETELWRMRADGTGAVRLLTNERYIRDPTWSPDGQLIAYVSYALSPGNAAGGEIRVTDRNGTLSRSVFLECRQYGSGAIGSDLTWGINGLLAFEGVTCSEPADWWLLTVKPDGSELTRVRRTRTSAKVKVDPLTPKSLDWSPDGTRLLLVAERKTATYNCGGYTPGYSPTDVYVLDPASADSPVNLTNTPEKFGVREVSAAWSPDGQQIVLSGITEACVDGRQTTTRPQLYTINADGSGLKQITRDDRPGQEGGTNDDDPSWQPCIAGKTASCVSTAAPKPGEKPTPTPSTKRATCAGPLVRADVLGQAPGYASGWKLAGFANDSAVCHAVWVPTLATGFVPQGLAISGQTALVSGYDARLAGKNGYGPNDGPCRIVAVNLETGKQEGKATQFRARTRGDSDVKASPRLCEHGGGLHLDPQGGLWLATTRYLYLLERNRLFTGSYGNDAVVGWILLDGLNGSFLTTGTSTRDLWIGTWSKDSPSTLHKFTYAQLRAKAIPTGGRLSPRNADTTMRIGRGAQGGVFVGSRLHVTASTSTCGVLSLGDNSDRRGFGPGAEEVETGPSGRAWVVHEAGSYHFKKPQAFFPVIAEINLAKTVAPPTCGGNLGSE